MRCQTTRGQVPHNVSRLAPTTLLPPPLSRLLYNDDHTWQHSALQQTSRAGGRCRCVGPTVEPAATLQPQGRHHQSTSSGRWVLGHGTPPCTPRADGQSSRPQQSGGQSTRPTAGGQSAASTACVQDEWGESSPSSSTASRTYSVRANRSHSLRPDSSRSCIVGGTGAGEGRCGSMYMWHDRGGGAWDGG